tara:strand:+ start:529 stop:1284 length:756 start_codon:yes stop_codon:yes gene_type:complete
MDFRNKKPQKQPTGGSRWGNLKTDDDDSNSFQTVQRRGRRNKREQETSEARDRRENLPGTMKLPGLDDVKPTKPSGKYVAPGSRNRHPTPPKRQGLALSRDRTPPKPRAPSIADNTAFPTLGETPVENNNVDTNDIGDKSFAELCSTRDPPPVKEKVYKDDIKPGWVRLSRGPNGELVREYGPEVPKSQFWIDWERAEVERKHQALIDTLERNMAYVRWAYPYENWYEPSDDEYESDDGMIEEWVSDEDQY